MKKKKQKGKKRLSVDQRMDLLLAQHEEGEVSPWRIFKIITEFVKGFEFLKKLDKAATIFGTARCRPTDPLYHEAHALAYQLAKAKFAVITGGGPGVMEAVNKGAKDAHGKSIGINIQLPHEQRTNPYVTQSESFNYFFTRKVMLSFASEVYIFFPGGFGTLDEFYEIVTLVQTQKITPIPVVLVGKEFWSPLLKWMEEAMYKKNKAISKKDMTTYHLVDSADEAFRLIKRLVKGDHQSYTI